MSAAPLGKDLLGLEELSAEQIRLILDTAQPFREISERTIKKVPTLRGKTVIMNFWTKTCRPCLEEMPSLADLGTHSSIWGLLTVPQALVSAM